MSRVLTVNPGGTSTKFAVFDDERVLLQRTLEHPAAELAPFARMPDQAGYRQGLIMAALAEAGIPATSLQAVVGRGGLLKPMVSGTYRVNAAMLDDCREAARGAHAANLGAIIADEVARPLGIPAVIVDPVAVDEMDPEARLSGLPELPRTSLGHALNSKAVARRVAAEMGRPYPEARFVVVGDARAPDYAAELRAAAARLGLDGALCWAGPCDDMPTAYNALDVLVLSSMSESFPNAVGEAMACGIPCVVTDVGDAAELVGETGYVVPRQDPLRLGEAIAALLERPVAQREMLGVAARNRVAAAYRQVALARRTEAALAGLIA